MSRNIFGQFQLIIFLEFNNVRLSTLTFHEA